MQLSSFPRRIPALVDSVVIRHTRQGYKRDPDFQKRNPHRLPLFVQWNLYLAEAAAPAVLGRTSNKLKFMIIMLRFTFINLLK